ncbi:SsrA-binding protein SmpB [Pontibacter sp. G13]|uniref:SsrA-binding protein SmpB n=1 Tax=Pontibacter sp. G13 TaxID=3074898 RepID=UPI00288AD8C3|nr:SsrA-binding protein SmpB [Pontibacter sp. G13]WNJ19176.1 SsrA-binding protein SmpB [Pontibacter sp. G13]
MEKGRNTTVISNRKARHEYHIEDTFTAGLVLTGTEVKSLRAGNASLQEAYCYVEKGEAFIKNMNISEYDKGSYNNHEPARLRKLLMKKREIEKIRKGLEQKGYTLVPLKIYFNDRNLAKLDLGLAKGKKVHDKRDDLKAKDTKREIDRQMKDY